MSRKKPRKFITTKCQVRTGDGWGQREEKRNRSTRLANKRAAIWRKKPRCCWCKRPLKFEDATLEHLIPKSQGGTDRSSNLDIACLPCNRDRHTPGWHEWIELRKRGIDEPFAKFAERHKR